MIRAPLQGELLLPGDTITVSAGMHPLRASAEVLDLPSGLSLTEIVEIVEKRCHVSRLAEGADVTISGHVVDPALWSRVRVKAGAHVGIRARAGKGLGGILRSLLQIALAVVASFIVGPAGLGIAGAIGGIAGQVVAGAVYGAIMIGGGLLLNALFPPTSTKSDDQNQSYSISAGRNAASKWGAIPVVLGKIRASPKYASSAYTEFDGDDQYLRMLFVWGYGPMKIEDIKIGDTSIDEYDDVEIQTFEGYASDGQQTLYPSEVVQEDMSVQPEYDDPVKRTSAEDAVEIVLDFVAPSGLGKLNSKGKFDSRSVVFKVEMSPAGADTWTDKGTITLRGKSNKAIRQSFRYPVALGEYDIRVTRQTADSDSSKVFDDVVWSAIKSFRTAPPIDFAKPLAITALRIRATKQLNGVVDNLSAIVTSRGHSWDGTQWELDTETNNPADLFRLVLQGPANARAQPDARLDLSTIQAWADRCRAAGFVFNMYRDFTASVRDTLRDVAAAGRAIPVFRDGRWSVTWEEDTAPVVQHFTPRNSRDFRWTQTYRILPHALRCKFVNEDKDYIEDEMLVYRDGYTKENATLTEQAEFPGVTKSDLIYKHGRYRIADAEERPAVYTVTVDFEHLVSQRADRVAVGHDIIRQGLCSGRIRAIAGQVLTLDEPAPMEAGKLYGIRIRREDGSSVVRQVTTQAGVHDQITIVGAVPEVGDLYTFGPRDHETGIYRILAIRPGEDLSAEVDLVDDGENVQAGDSDTDIPGTSNEPPSPLAVYRPTNLRAEGFVETITTGNRYNVRLYWEAVVGPEYQSFEAVAISSETTWRVVVDGQTRACDFRNMQTDTWEFQVRAILADGRPTPPSDTLVLAVDVPWDDLGVDGSNVIDGTLSITKFADDITPVELGEGDPSDADPNNFEGRTYVNTLTGVLWTYHDGHWGHIEADVLDDSITTAKLADSAVTADKLMNAAVTALKIADSAVQANKIATGAVLESKLADNAVTVNKIAAAAVNATKLADGSVLEAKIANNAVTVNKVADLAISAAKIANGAVTTLKLADLAVDASKLAAGAVTTAKFAAGLTPVEVVSTLPTTGNFEGRQAYLTTDDKVYRYTGTAWTAAVAAANVTGQLTDAQIAAVAAAKLTGQIAGTQISDGAISTPKLAAGSVTTAALAAGAVTADDIAANAVTTAKLAAGAVTANELAANAVTADKILANAITTGKIATGAVTADQIAANAVTTEKIAANAVVADKIAANAVTARNLVVTDGNNLVPDNQMLDVASWVLVDAAWSYVGTVASGFANGRGFQYTKAGGTTGYSGFLGSLPFPVVPNEKYLASIQTYSTGTYGVLARIQWFKVDGTPASAGQTVFCDAVYTAGGVRTTAAEVQVPADARTARWHVYANNDQTTAANFLVGAPVVKRKDAASLIVSGGILADSLAANSVTTAKIATGAVTANEIAAGAIVAGKIGAGAVVAASIAANAVTTAALAAGAVTANEIAAGAITTAKLGAGVVTANELAAGAVTAAKIAAGSVTSDKMVANSITARELVLTDFSNVVPDADKMTDGWTRGATGVTVGGLAGSPWRSARGLYYTKPAGATGYYNIGSSPIFSVMAGQVYQAYAQIWVNTGSHQYWIRIQWFDATGAALTGGEGTEYTTSVPNVSRTGFVDINTEVTVPATARFGRVDIYVLQQTFNDGAIGIVAGLMLRKKGDANLIVDGAITAGKIAANAVTAGKIAANAVTAGTIAAGAVSATEIAAGAVTAVKIAANAIVVGKIAADSIVTNNLVLDTATKVIYNVKSDSETFASSGAGFVRGCQNTVDYTAGAISGSATIKFSSSISNGKIGFFVMASTDGGTSWTQLAGIALNSDNVNSPYNFTLTYSMKPDSAEEVIIALQLESQTSSGTYTWISASNLTTYFQR